MPKTEQAQHPPFIETSRVPRLYDWNFRTITTWNFEGVDYHRKERAVSANPDQRDNASGSQKVQRLRRCFVQDLSVSMYFNAKGKNNYLQSALRKMFPPTVQGRETLDAWCLSKVIILELNENTAKLIQRDSECVFWIQFCGLEGSMKDTVASHKDLDGRAVAANSFEACKTYFAAHEGVGRLVSISIGDDARVAVCVRNQARAADAVVVAVAHQRQIIAGWME